MACCTYNHTMPLTDAEWVAQKMEELKRKRAILAQLEDSLRAWEQRVDLTALPPEKQTALAALAAQSADTLRALIARLGQDITQRHRELDRRDGEAPLHG